MSERLINDTLLCYDLPTSPTDGFFWQTEIPIIKSLPIFVSQLFIILFITRLLFLVFKPLHQPFLIAEIVAGCIVGPSALGSFKFVERRIFPTRGFMLIETMADLSLLFYVFLTGLEVDVSAFLRVGKKIMGIAVTGILIPMVIGIGLFFLLQKHTHNATTIVGCLFWAIPLTITGFPVLTRILADLKLLHSDIGRIAMSVAMLNDMSAWIFIAVLVPIGVNLKTAPYSIIAIVFFILICFYLVRPAIERISCQGLDKEHFSEYYPCFMLIGAMFCGCITDAIGAHSIVGAFVFGLIIPKGDMVEELLDRLDCFVPGLMLPIFFASCGMRTDFTKIVESSSWFSVLLVICFACMAKILSSLIACFFFDMRLRDGMALGFLMNTKGILSLVILNAGRDKKVLNDQYYAVMVAAMLVMTSVVSPIMSAVYRPKSKAGSKIYGLRTIQRSKPDTEFRVLSCVHTMRNVSGMVSLLEVSHPTRLSPMTVFALHLVELTGHSSTMLIVHSTRKSAAHNPSRAQADSNLIINAFEAFENDNHLVTVQPLTAMSPYDTMHEDICSLAEDKRAALILLPFHKHLTVDGQMEDENIDYRALNLSVLANAPCSVGLFIDRGLAGALRSSNGGPNDHVVVCRFAMLFIGGPDDREALAYACRMAGHPRISLTVVRFLPSKEVVEMESAINVSTEVEEMLSAKHNNKRQTSIDEHYINEFRLNTVDNESVVYIEKMVNNGEETVSAISAMDNSFDLYIVGKGTGIMSPLTLGLSEWSDSPELGAIGDVLVSSSFALNSSVLVVQKYGSGDLQNEGRLPSFDASRGEHFSIRQRVTGGWKSWQSSKMVLSDNDWPLGNG